MSDLETLSNELSTDPLRRGYSSMTDKEVAIDLNTPYRIQIRTSLSADEMFAVADPVEFVALSSAKEELWVSWCNSDRDPSKANNIEFIKYIFGDSSTTVSNVMNLRRNSISRGQEIGYGRVRVGNVMEARL